MTDHSDLIADTVRLAVAKSICLAMGDDWEREGPGDVLMEAYGPLADAALSATPQGSLPEHADATSNPPLSDLSSLRKGAEVAVKPLVWTSASPPSWYAVCPVSRKGYIIDREEGKWWACWNVDLPGFDDLDEAKAAAQSDYETRIRSALVSGSREDQS